MNCVLGNFLYSFTNSTAQVFFYHLWCFYSLLSMYEIYENQPNFGKSDFTKFLMASQYIIKLHDVEFHKT